MGLFGRGNGAMMMRSAFTFLLTGNDAYATPVRSELLQQITEAGTDFTNASKWCVGTTGGSNFFEVVPWLDRLLVAYDYLIAGGYSGLSAPEKTNIEQWFLDAAEHFVAAQDKSLTMAIITEFTMTPQDLTCVGDCTGTFGIVLYDGGLSGPGCDLFTFFNQTSTVARFCDERGRDAKQQRIDESRRCLFHRILRRAFTMMER